MKRTLALISLSLLIVLVLGSVTALADAVMTWSFGTFNNPNARQVALNIANRQLELAREEDDEKTIMERFKESLERMQMSEAIRDLINFDPDEPEQENYGWLPLGDSWLFWHWDEENETMTVWYWEDGRWTEAPFNPPEKKPEPPIVYPNPNRSLETDNYKKE